MLAFSQIRPSLRASSCCDGCFFPSLVAAVTAEDNSQTDASNGGSCEESPSVQSLYEQFGTDLFRFAVSLLRNGDEAEEVVQTVFRKAVERFDTVKTSFRGWLFQVAYNEVALVRRNQSREKVVLTEAAWEISAGRVGQFEDARERLESREQIEKVRRAIALLAEDQRLIVRMRIYENKKFSVIAEELGIPLGTALTRMRSAMQKLEQLLSRNKDD